MSKQDQQLIADQNNEPIPVPPTGNEVGQDDQDGRVRIKLTPGDMYKAVDDIEQAMAAHALKVGYEVFNHGSGLVRLQFKNKPKLGAPPQNPVKIVECTKPFLQKHFSKIAVFKCGGSENIDLPARYIAALMENEASAIPILTGVVTAPTLRADASWLCQNGYDESTGLYAHLGDDAWDVPEAPDFEMAKQSLEDILNFFRFFPFEAGSDASTAVAALLTVLVRPSLPTSPMFCFDATSSGAGKSLLADLVGLAATGFLPSLVSHTDHEESERKRIISILRSGARVINIDNIERPLKSAVLCGVTTSSVYGDRLLNKTEMIDALTRITLIATGNNVQVVGDLRRRTLSCRLAPQCENPWEREFEGNIANQAILDRKMLVIAGLTIVKAYRQHIEQGGDAQKLKPFGRFEQWSDWVRSPLVWLGMEDPCLGLQRWNMTDTDGEILSNVLEKVGNLFHSNEFTTAMIIEKAAADPELKEALMDVAGKNGKINSRKLGSWIRRFSGTWKAGRCFAITGNYGHAKTWRVQTVEPIVVDAPDVLSDPAS